MSLKICLLAAVASVTLAGCQYAQTGERPAASAAPAGPLLFEDNFNSGALDRSKMGGGRPGLLGQ